MVQIFLQILYHYLNSLYLSNNMLMYKLYTFKNTLNKFLTQHQQADDKMKRLAYMLLTTPQQVTPFYKQFQKKMDENKTIKLLMLTEFCINNSVRLNQQVITLLTKIKFSSSHKMVTIISKYIAFLQKRLCYEYQERQPLNGEIYEIFVIINMIQRGVKLVEQVMKQFKEETWIGHFVKILNTDIRNLYYSIKEIIGKIGVQGQQYELIISQIQKINEEIVEIYGKSFQGLEYQKLLPDLLYLQVNELQSPVTQASQ